MREAGYDLEKSSHVSSLDAYNGTSKSLQLPSAQIFNVPIFYSCQI